MPYVMLWNPLHQFQMHFRDGIRCFHEQCDSSFSVKVWKCGQTNALESRIIHDVSHTILLVSAVYTCQNGHKVASTDPRILLQLTEEEHMPFILLHRTGFTRDFVHTALQLFVQGLHLKSIETFIFERRLNFCQSKLLCLLHQLQMCSSNERRCSSDINNLAFQLLRFPTPSNDVLTKCFLVHFQQCKHAYEKSMSSLTATKFISFDHTFKLATNIGYIRHDGCWITKYSSAFFVLNEAEQVLSWQLTSSTSLDEVYPALDALALRFRKQAIAIPLVLVDNCCHIRNKIITIFGAQTRVALDLFHAVQRVSRELSRFHPLYYDCLNDLKLVFREPKDMGKITNPEAT